MNIIVYASRSLKALRQELHLTQAEMAFSINIDQSTYSRYENGRTPIPITIIQVISEIYAICPSRFFIRNTPLPEKSRGNQASENAVQVPKELADQLLKYIGSGSLHREAKKQGKSL